MTDETIRRETEPTDYVHSLTERPKNTSDDDVLMLPLRRERESGSLTKREREERWPIG